MGIIKLGGIASGMDTETLIKQLMIIERRPAALLEQRNDKLTSKANAWRDLNARMLTLDSRVRTLRGLTSSVWDAQKVSVADTTVISAKLGSGAQVGSHTVEVVTLASEHTWKSNLAVADAGADLGYSGTVKVVGGTGDSETFTVAATDSLNEIAATINSQKTELGFTASVLQVGSNDYRLVLKGNETGADQYFELIDDPADPLSTVAVDLQMTAATATASMTAADGLIRVNNIDISVATNTVTAAVPGVTLTLLEAGTTTVSVAADQSKAIDAVKGFVDQYNSVVEFIDSLTKYDATNKKAATLQGESTILNLRMGFSRFLHDPVATLDPALNSLAMVGITTEAFSGEGVSGKLTFDQSKFVAALEADPATVEKLFTLDDGTNQGVGVRMADLIGAYAKTGGMLLKQADALDTTIDRATERIKYHDEVLLPQKEKRLRAQFTALEKAMSMLQNQGNWFKAQVDNLPKYGSAN